MKITCILTSFNRPRMVREALQSIQNQTHKDYQLIVVDDSDALDIEEVMKEFKFDNSLVIRHKVNRKEPPALNRLGFNINSALPQAKGNVVAYLADDDALFPGWFSAVSDHFERHPDHQVAFGILKYSQGELDLSEMGEIRFWDEVVLDPMGRLDHNQVVHRRFDPPQKWSENIGTEMNVDGWFFSQLANFHQFHPINAWAACKRLHGKNLQGSVGLYQSGGMAGLLRE